MLNHESVFILKRKFSPQNEESKEEILGFYASMEDALLANYYHLQTTSIPRDNYSIRIEERILDRDISSAFHDITPPGLHEDLEEDFVFNIIDEKGRFVTSFWSYDEAVAAETALEQYTGKTFRILAV